jgi:hypothetical protein
MCVDKERKRQSDREGLPAILRAGAAFRDRQVDHKGHPLHFRLQSLASIAIDGRNARFH